MNEAEANFAEVDTSNLPYLPGLSASEQRFQHEAVVHGYGAEAIVTALKPSAASDIPSTKCQSCSSRKSLLAIYGWKREI